MIKWRQQKGFTLFEILVATGLFAVSAVVFLEGVLFATDLRFKDQRKLKGLFLANQRLIELEMEIESDSAKGSFPDEKTEKGVFEGEDNQNYVWEYEIKKIELPAQTGNETNAIALAAINNVFDQISKAVREVTLKVSWVEDPDKEAPEEIKLTTHIVKLR